MLWRHNFVAEDPISMKFGMPMENHMSITVNKSKSKPEVEFQYTSRLFSDTGSSNISAVDWYIWSKFGKPIALDLPKCQTWPNQKPEVDFRRGVQERCRASSHCSARRRDRFASWLATLQWTLFRPRRRRSRQHVPKAVSFSRHGIQHDWKGTISGVHVSSGSAEILVMRSGINKSPFASILSQQHLCEKLPKSVDVRRSYSVLHQCRFLRHSVVMLARRRAGQRDDRRRRLADNDFGGWVKTTRTYF